MMYYISKLTSKIYTETFVEIIQDDNLQDFQNYLLNVSNGAEVISVDSVEGESIPVIVPKQLSRMKFIMQVFITTTIKYEDIVSFINDLPYQVLDDDSKYLVLTRLIGCTHFERNSEDLLTIAGMMEITSEQLDEIFINGNLIE